MDIDTIKQIFKDIDEQIEEYRTLRDNYKSCSDEQQTAEFIMYSDKIDGLLKLRLNLTKKYFSRNTNKTSKP